MDPLIISKTLIINSFSKTVPPCPKTVSKLTLHMVRKSRSSVIGVEQSRNIVAVWRRIVIYKVNSLVTP